jgi:hypothetical protein
MKNIKILIFGGISKFSKLIVFGQILVDSGSFGQILLHCWWPTTIWQCIFSPYSVAFHVAYLCCEVDLCSHLIIVHCVYRNAQATLLEISTWSFAFGISSLKELSYVQNIVGPKQVLWKFVMHNSQYYTVTSASNETPKCTLLQHWKEMLATNIIEYNNPFDTTMTLILHV